MSRRHRGRYLPRSKRKKFKRAFYSPPQQAAVAPQQSAAQPPEPKAEAVPVVKTPPPPIATPTQPLNVTAEIRMMGIISGIILVILIVLAFILP